MGNCWYRFILNFLFNSWASFKILPYHGHHLWYCLTMDTIYGIVLPWTPFKVMSYHLISDTTLTMGNCWYRFILNFLFSSWASFKVLPYHMKEGNVLFNDALNTFYLRLHGVRHMVKNHSDSERGNPLPSHGLLFLISSKGSFICTISQTGYHIPQPLLHHSWSTGWNEK